MSSEGVTAVVLGLVAAALFAGVLALGVLLRRRGEELATARARIIELETAVLRLEANADPRAARVAKTAARAVIGTAGRLREGGVRAGVSGLVSASIDELGRVATEERVQIERIATPDGTVTILFSDIVDSTARNELLGDKRWLKVLRAHDTLVRRAVADRRGHVVKSQGDGYMVVFPDALGGVLAALAIQHRLRERRRLRSADIRLRIGLHTGRALSHDGDYFGRNVALAARVAAYGSADEILVSEAVHDAIADAPGMAVELAATTDLKGLSGEHRLYRVTAAD